MSKPASVSKGDLKRPRRRALALPCMFALVASIAAVVSGCRNDPPSSIAADAGVEASVALSDDGDADTANVIEDASGLHARELEARAADARLDAGAFDPACEGPSLSLFGAALDARCATFGVEYTRLLAESGDGGAHRDGGSSRGFRQEARVDEGRLEFSIVNASPAPRSLPIRMNPERNNVFSVLAENARGEVFELAAPKLDLVVRRETDGGPSRPSPRTGYARTHDLAALRRDGGSSRVYSSAIRLPADGRATATMTIEPSVVARVAPQERGRPSPPCDVTDAASCVPARLPKGRYTLYVGQVFSEVDTGPPARVLWDAP